MEQEVSTIDASADSIAPVHGPLKCKLHTAVEGWIVFVSGIHPEAQEDDIYDLFSEYGKISNLHMNLDRKTASNKGYALIEYKDLDSAQSAVLNANHKEYQGQTLRLDFAFKHPLASQPPK